MPMIPPINTKTYGIIWIRLYSWATVPLKVVRKDKNRISTRVTRAAGNAIPKFSLNLSFIAQPCPLHAAIVVSEINERLSPNIAPPITAPMQRGRWKPEAWDTATAIGAIKVMVPTEVPIAVDTKQATTNSTATANRAGMSESIKYATLSALLLPTTPTKEPATRKIRSIVIIFLSAIPWAISSSLSSNFTSLFCRQATRIAARNATTIGIL